jgi:hypothetical protein
METSLIPPAQLWNFGITVDVVPKQYSDGKSLHGIHHPDSNTFIPFHLHGCISYFSTRLPTQEEIDTCQWLTFTSDAEWKPYDNCFKEAEQAMINHHRYPDSCHPHFDRDGNELDGRQFKALTTIKSLLEHDPSFCTLDFTLHHSIGATSSREHRSNVPPDVLARRWGTSISNAADTTMKTVQ